MTTEERNFLTEKRDLLLKERDSQIELLRTKYDRKLNAYAVLLEEAPATNVETASFLSSNSYQQTRTTSSSSRKPKSLMEAIRAAIQDIEKYDGAEAHFSTITVGDRIEKLFPDMAAKLDALSNLFWRMRKGNEIEIVKKGIGRTPTIYKKMNTPP